MHDALPVASLWQDGIFETMRSERKRIIALEEHVNRLFESAHSISLSLGTSRDALKRLLEKEVASRLFADATIRITFVREGRSSRLFLIVKEAKQYPISCYEKGVAIRTSPTRRNAIFSVDAQMKTREFLNGILSTLDGASSQEDAFEEIYLDASGYVTEGRISNIFFAKEKRLFTPPLFLGVLRGITRDQTIQAAKRIGVSVHEEPFTRFNLYGAEEVFLTNTSMGAMPVVSVDKRVIGDGKIGPVTQKFIQIFRSRKGNNA